MLLVGKGAPERGGIASFLEQVASAPVTNGVVVEFLNLARPVGSRMGRLSIGNIVRTLSDAVTVFRRALRSDVVHIHSAFVPTVTIIRAGMLIRAAKWAGNGVILHAHGGLFPGWLDEGGSRRVVRWALRRVDRIVTVSERGLRAIESVHGVNSALVMRNGIDSVAFHPADFESSQGTPVIGYVGILSERKGLLDLFEASRRLSNEGVAHRLQLIGGTPAEGSAEGQRISGSAPETVDLVGEVERSRIPELMAGFDVFCLPSWWEAAPMSILEAMACGLPVVATDVGDIPTMVFDGVTGRLVPARDPVRLAEALAQVIGDSKIRAEMGRAGRQLALEQFDWPQTFARLVELYREVA